MRSGDRGRMGSSAKGSRNGTHGSSSTIHRERVDEGDEEDEHLVDSDCEMSFSDSEDEEFVAQGGVESKNESTYSSLESKNGLSNIESDKEDEIEGFDRDEV